MALVAVVLLAATLGDAEDDESEIVAASDSPATTVQDERAAARSLLLFGDSGISRHSNGDARPVWSEPVHDAFPDGDGGVVFRDDRAIWWLRAGASEPEELSLGDAGLHAVVDLGGAATMLITRVFGEHSTEERIETLYGIALATGEETNLGITGGYDSGLDAVAVDSGGTLLTSTCHLQCAVWAAGQDEPIVEADWISGLDAAADALAYVRFTFVPENGTTVDPVLVVADLDGAVRNETALPIETPDASTAASVDLAPDGDAAIVWLDDGPAIVVDALGSAEPRVGDVPGGQLARFAAEPPAPAAVEDETPTALVDRFLDALRRDDLDAAAAMVGNQEGDDPRPAITAMLDAFPWLAGERSLDARETRSWGWTPETTYPIVTVLTPSREGEPRRASAFLVAPSSARPDDAQLLIQRLPQVGTSTPRAGTPLAPGDRVVFDHVGVTRAPIGRRLLVPRDHVARRLCGENGPSTADSAAQTISFR